MNRDFLRPTNPGREYILDTLGEDSGKFRNPVRIKEMTGSYPKPQDERARGYEKILGHERTPSARKGPF